MQHSVLVVEDDPQMRARFAEAVCKAGDLRLAGTADDLPSGRRLLDETAPDVLLVDIGLPSGSGIELIRHARRCLPKCESMVVTVFAEDGLVIECIEAGATGYLLKDSGAVDIAQQVRLLCAGGSPISPAIARRLLMRFGGKTPEWTPQTMSGVTLSSQEQQVLALSAKGYNYEEIAGLMRLSHHTVETYVKRMYRKLQVHSKTEAVYEARKLGLMRD